MTDIIEEDILQLLTLQGTLLILLGTLHLLLQTLAPSFLLDDNSAQRYDNDRSDKAPDPVRNLKLTEFRADFSIDLVNHTFRLHLFQLLVNGVYQLLVMTHVAVFTWHQGQILRNEIIQMVRFYQITGLITVTDHTVVLSCRQFIEGFLQVFDQHTGSTAGCQRVNDGL